MNHQDFVRRAIMALSVLALPMLSGPVEAAEPPANPPNTRQLPLGGLDNIGITPDVPVPDHLADPLAFALRLLAEP